MDGAAEFLMLVSAELAHTLLVKGGPHIAHAVRARKYRNISDLGARPSVLHDDEEPTQPNELTWKSGW